MRLKWDYLWVQFDKVLCYPKDVYDEDDTLAAAFLHELCTCV